MIRKFLKVINNPELLKEKVKFNLNKSSIFLNNGYQFFPFRSISIYVNGCCNLKCKFCDVGQKNSDSEFSKTIRAENLDLNVYKKLINSVKKYSPNISINGMEPLIYTYLDKIINYTTIKNKLKCNLTTNGYYLEKNAEILVKNKLNILNISIDGLSKTHNYTRGCKDVFENILKGIDAINKIKSINQTNYPLIVINCTISKINEDELYSFYSFFKNKSICKINFMHINYLDNSMVKKCNLINGDFYKVNTSSIFDTNIKLTNYRIIYNEIKKIKAEDKNGLCKFSPDMNNLIQFKNYYKYSEKIISKNKCFIFYNHVQILSNGDVVPGARCHFHKIIGNIKENNLIELWNSENYKDLRIWFKKNNFLTPACTRCCGLF
jgi:Fe-coproporphyrin III synthase